MRKNIIILSIVSVGFLSSCGTEEIPSTELDELNAKREVFQNRVDSIQALMDTLDVQISKLDSTGGMELKKVSSIKVQEEVFEHYFEIQGAVEAEKNVLVVPEVGGLIQSLRATEGQTINKGDIIATFDSKVVSDSKDELKEQLDIAKEMLEKQERLLSQGVGTDIAVKQAKSQYLSIKQTLESVENQAGKFVLKAPFTGYVEQVFPVQGQMAGPTTPIIRLISLDKMSVKADISESYLKGVDNNSVAQLNFPALGGKPITGLKLKRIGKFVNPVNRTITVEVEIPSPSEKHVPNLMSVLRIRDFVDSSAVVIPTSLIRKELVTPCVYVIHENEAIQTEVELGQSSGNFTVIKSGIKSGDLIVNKGLRGLNKEIEKIIID